MRGIAQHVYSHARMRQTLPLLLPILQVLPCDLGSQISTGQEVLLQSGTAGARVISSRPRLQAITLL